MPHKTIEGIKDINPNQWGGMCSRAVELVRDSIDFEKGIETIATTDAPALVIDWERWRVIREVLPMRYAEMPNNDRVPLLDSHSRFSVENILGSARNWSTNETQLLAKTFVSESEPQVRDKIKEGHIDSVSIGYRTDKKYSVEVPKKAEVSIDGTVYKNSFDDDYPMVVRTWWKTHELSLVPIGADDAAKFKGNDEQMRRLLERISSMEEQIKALMKGKNKSLFQRRYQRILSDINNY